MRPFLLNQAPSDSFLKTAWRWDVQVARLRLLGDYHHSTRIAFVEFVMVGVLSSSVGHLIIPTTVTGDII
jgi:hypothetical protein